MRGGTFTISNLGAVGGTYSTPIINPPEVAILLTGRSRKLPVVMEDDSLKPRLMLLVVNRCALLRSTLVNNGSFLNFESRDMQEIINVPAYTAFCTIPVTKKRRRGRRREL